MGIGEYREFIELNHHSSFTEAAAELNMTQPALSKHVAALEKEFGAPLLLRNHRGLSLTDEGKIALQAAMTIVDAHDSAVKAIKRLGMAVPIRVDGTLYDEAISAIVSLATILFEDGDSPHISVSHHEGESYVDLLDRNEIDIALSYLSKDELEDHRLAMRPLTQVQFVAIVDSDNPLAQRDQLSMDDLRDQTLVQLVDKYAYPGWRRIEKVCRDHGFEPKKRPIVGSPAGYASIAPRGCVYIQQRNLKQNRLLRGAAGMVQVPITDEDAHFNTDCIYRKVDEERLAPFLDTLEEARDTVENHAKRGRKA